MGASLPFFYLLLRLSTPAFLQGAEGNQAARWSEFGLQENLIGHDTPKPRPARYDD